MLALIGENEIVSTFGEGGWFTLPNGSQASPAHDGWTNGTYRLAEIQPADEVPEGKRVVSTSVELIDGEPKYVHALEEDPATDLAPLTSRQLRLGLILNGIGLEQVEATIGAIDDEQGRNVARIEWEYASQFDRAHPLIEQVGMALGLSPEQINTMWEASLQL